jgi:segregation and condensation protein A
VDCANPLEVIARFMGLLELFREATIALDQPECFGELTVRWTPPGTAEGVEDTPAGDDRRA